MRRKNRTSSKTRYRGYLRDTRARGHVVFARGMRVVLLSIQIYNHYTPRGQTDSAYLFGPIRSVPADPSHAEVSVSLATLAFSFSSLCPFHFLISVSVAMMPCLRPYIR
jgi:hypothetical protein